jgi:hypothetical protein
MHYQHHVQDGGVAPEQESIEGEVPALRQQSRQLLSSTWRPRTTRQQEGPSRQSAGG